MFVLVQRQGARERRQRPGANAPSVRLDVPDLSPEEAERLRRSIAMLPPRAPSGLSHGRALAILGTSGVRGSGASS
jgi:hypothetical protein